MGVASYFEFITTLLAWVLYDKVWAILVDTSLVFVPFITMIVGHIMTSRMGGDDEGSAAVQSLKKIETDLYMMIGVLVFAAVPVMDVRLGEMTYVKPALSCSATEETIDGSATGTSYDAVLTTLGGETGRVPIWWGAMHTLSKAVVSSSIASLPCANEVSTVGYKLAGDKISPPALRKELGDFIKDCYKASKAKKQRTNAGSLTPAQHNDSLWIGSEYFRTTDGYYNYYYSQNPRNSFPHNAGRDAGFDADAQTGGHPTCNEWWGDGANGIRARVLDSIEPDLLNEMIYSPSNLLERVSGAFLSAREKEDVFLRKYLDVQQVSLGMAGSSVSTGYHVSGREAVAAAGGGWGSKAIAFAGDLIVGGVAAIGAAVEAPKAVTEGYAIRNGISLIQALVLMMLVIMLPFLMLFSQYKASMVMNLSIIFFTLHLLSFVWAIAFWIENNLLESMVGSGGLSVFTPGENATQTTLMWFMERFLYVILPMIVLASLGWVGIRSAGITDQISNMGSRTGAVGAAGGNLAAKAATKGNA